MVKPLRDFSLRRGWCHSTVRQVWTNHEREIWPESTVRENGGQIQLHPVEVRCTAVFTPRGLVVCYKSRGTTASRAVNGMEAAQRQGLYVIGLACTLKAQIHIKGRHYAQDTWKALQKAYDDQGLTSRLGLMRELLGQKLAKHDGMESYLSTISELSLRKLRNFVN